MVTGYVARLWWIDDQGGEHHLTSWASRAPLGRHVQARSEASWHGSPGRQAEARWYGLALERGIVSRFGDGYPTRYTIRPTALIHLLTGAAATQLRDNRSLALAPLDTTTVSQEVMALPPGTLVHVEEWDQS